MGTHTPDNVLNYDHFNQVMESVGSGLRDLLMESAVINSSAFEGELDGERAYNGSSVENALLALIHRDGGFKPIAEERDNARVFRRIPFTADRKFMSTTVMLSNGQFRVYVKGAGEVVLGRCPKVIENPQSDDLSSVILADEGRQFLQKTIDINEQHGLCPITLAYRDDTDFVDNPAQAHQGLTLVAILGIKDPLRHDIFEGVKDCQRAGVAVRMITGQSLGTAKSIALELGILGPESIAMEGPEFAC